MYRPENIFWRVLPNAQTTETEARVATSPDAASNTITEKVVDKNKINTLKIQIQLIDFEDSVPFGVLSNIHKAIGLVQSIQTIIGTYNQMTSSHLNDITIFFFIQYLPGFILPVVVIVVVVVLVLRHIEIL